MSTPSRSDGSAGSAVGSASDPRRSSGSSSTGAVESTTASSSFAVPLLPSSAVSSSASALPALKPSVCAAPSVTVEDESTKRCSACSEDRPVSAFSSAQLKKKGKRVCASCVAAKDLASSAAAAESAASARLDSMRPAFVSKLSACAPRAAAPCRVCHSKHSRLAPCVRCKTELCSVQCFDQHRCDVNLAFEAKLSTAQEQPAAECPDCGKQTTRLASCIRCTVECCSLKCFDEHDCDLYLEAKRTMPTELIPDEDRFHGSSEMVSNWKELLDYLHNLPASVSPRAVQGCARYSASLRQLDFMMVKFAEMMQRPLGKIYSLCVRRPWWNPPASARARYAAGTRELVSQLLLQVSVISQNCAAIVDECASAISIDLSIKLARDPRATVHGEWVPQPTIDCASACFLPGRLFHKMLTLARWVLRTVGSAWVQAHFNQPGDVSNDAFGLFPSFDSEECGKQSYLGYLELPSPDTGLRTLVPLFCRSPCARFPMLMQHLGHRMLSMVLRDGQLLLDRGLHLSALADRVEVTAVTGWTGKAMDSFSESPAQSMYWSDRWLLEHTYDPAVAADVRKEIEARKRPDFFHIVRAMQQMIPKDEWPSKDGETLFIATPQLGIESELVELSLLESLAEDAAAGNEQAQLLLTYIEAECEAPIADVISAQKSRLDQMLEDQAAQLRIHAEAVKRAESRARIKAAAAAEGEQKTDATAAASASALAPSAAASSSSSAVSTTCASSSLPAPAYSWTQSRVYKGLESLRGPGRKKYSTIMSAAKRLLYSLRPVSVNKRGGSHIVFHFASGAPATLVQMHAGGRSKDSTAHTTRLYAQFSEVAMQHAMAGSSAIEGAAQSGRDAASRKLLH